jgi:AcrR family transcriptional regulator
MRAAILEAAAEELAEAGFAGAKLSTIAARAGTSVGNFYKYFANKEALFAEAVPDDLVGAFRALLRRRVGALGIERDVNALDASHPYRAASDELLRFALVHRAQLLFLLRSADGTPYAGVAEEVARELARLAERYAREAYPTMAHTAATRRALLRIYRGFVAQIAAILAEERSERALTEAVARVGAYHLQGLRAFFRAEAERCASATRRAHEAKSREEEP